MVVHGEKHHRKGGPAERLRLRGWAALAEHRTSQRTQTAQVRGQAIAMSEKSSNFAAHLSKESKAALRPQDEEALRNR